MNSFESEHLQGFPEVVYLPVQWGDQDAFGHVNNAIYFRWYETARIAYFERLEVAGDASADLAPILASIRCDYRQQLLFPDTVAVTAKVSRIGRSSLVMLHRVVSPRLGIVAEGDSTIVTFNYVANRSQPVPAELRAKIELLEGCKFPPPEPKG